MTVKELIEHLQKMPPDRNVYIQTGSDDFYYKAVAVREKELDMYAMTEEPLMEKTVVIEYE